MKKRIIDVLIHTLSTFGLFILVPPTVIIFYPLAPFWYIITGKSGFDFALYLINKWMDIIIIIQNKYVGNN